MLKKSLITIWIGMICTVGPAQQVSDFNLRFTTPGTDSWSSLPVGNGDISAQVWTLDDGSLQFYIGKTDSRDAIDDLLKIGKLTLRFEPNILKDGTDYQEELLLDQGLFRVKNSLADISLRVDANHPAIIVSGSSSVPVKLTVVSNIWRRETATITTEESGQKTRPFQSYKEADNTIKGLSDAIIWFHRNQNQTFWKETMKAAELGAEFPNPLENRTFGAIVNGNNLLAVNDSVLASRDAAKTFSFRTTVLTQQTETPTQYVEALKSLSVQIGSIKEKKLEKAHRQWWKDFWNRSYVYFNSNDNRLNDTLQLLNRGYLLQRYVNAIAGRGPLPIKFNGSTLVLDTYNHPIAAIKGRDADFRQWGGPYWWQNTRLPYYSMFATGDFDLMQSFMDMYWNNLPVAKQMAKHYYGHEGAQFIETAHFWGVWRGGDVGWDRTGLKPGEAINPYVGKLYIAGLEMTNFMLDYYAYTGNAQFLHQRLLPFASEVLKFYDQHYNRNEKGKLVIDQAQSLETFVEGTNPLPDIAGLRFVVPRIRELATDPALLALCNKLEKSMPDLPSEIKNGQRILLPIESYGRRINMEYPELYAIFPFRLYGVGKEDLQTAVSTFRDKNREIRGWHQTGIQAAMLGLTEMAAHILKINGLAYDKRFRFPGFWGPNYDYTPDQDHAGNFMTTLQKMILQAEGEDIQLLPAWPKDWNVKFKLHAPHRTVVEGEWKNGSWTKTRTYPRQRGKNIRSAF